MEHETINFIKYALKFLRAVGVTNKIRADAEKTLIEFNKFVKSR